MGGDGGDGGGVSLKGSNNPASMKVPFLSESRVEAHKTVHE